MKIVKVILVFIAFQFSLLGMAQDPHSKSGLKKVIVQEVLQVKSYTYLNVLEDGTKKWIAVPTIEAKLGEVFYYKGGMEMPDFKSTELDRTFDAVIFIGSITKADAINLDKGMVESKAVVVEDSKPKKKGTLAQLELTIEGIEGCVRISDVFKNKALYAGKTIKIKGEVTKFNGGIMGKNWVHFQDGTSYEGAYDLMITSQENVNVGDTIILQGVLSLDKDFGAGYFYKVIMEAAVVVQ